MSLLALPLALPMDASHFRSWVKTWLRDARVRSGYSQEAAARAARVGIGIIRTAEQTGGPPKLANFLRLVAAYRAEDALVNQIREWRGESGEVAGGSEVAPNAPPDVNQVQRFPMREVSLQDVDDDRGNTGESRGT